MASKVEKRRKARYLCVQSLYEWHLSGNDMPEIITQSLQNSSEPVDSAYYREALQVIEREQDVIDEYLLSCSDRALAEMQAIEFAVLRLATYELLHRPDVPYRVVINEAVNNAKRFGSQDGHKFVNAVLDKLAPKLRPVECAQSKTP